MNNPYIIVSFPAILIYTGFFLLFWGIGKKMKQSMKYKVTVILLLAIVIADLISTVIFYILYRCGVTFNIWSIAISIMLPSIYGVTLLLLVGISLFMISKNYPQIEKIFK